jgi:hypothetical protein
MTTGSFSPPDDPLLQKALLSEGRIVDCSPLYSGSNLSFRVTLSHVGRTFRGIYKPRDGEAPLRDFPDGTLYLREYAAYLVSRELGWPSIPTTVIRDGPYGIGSFQWCVDAVPHEHYLTLRERHQSVFQQIAAFDCLTNNADRKSGHCLLDSAARIWSIDHGLTFHTVWKLRTVIWDFAAQPMPTPILEDLERLRGALATGSRLVSDLSALLEEREIVVLGERAEALVSAGIFPSPDPYRRSVPWPAI